MWRLSKRRHYRWLRLTGHAPDIRLLAKVARLEKQKETRFLFGLEKSPSIVTPADAYVLTGIVVAGDEKLISRKFDLVLPKRDMGDISVNDYVALGVMKNDICIGIEKIPVAEDRAKQIEWVADWRCPGERR